MSKSIEEPNYKFIQLFFKYEDDPNSSINYSFEYETNIVTYIEHVIKENNLEILKLLIEYGGNINQKITIYSGEFNENIDGYITPLDLAISIGNKEIIAYIKSKGGKEKLYENE